MKEQILVTGGTGYIGSHTAVELINQGYNVVIVDNLSNSDINVLEGISEITGVKPEFEKIDLTDYTSLQSFFVNHPSVSAVIHFAASKAVGESVSQPLFYYKNNLLGLINLLEVMKSQKVTDLVFSSSCTVYGQPDEFPVTEESPIKKATSPYGNTKQIGEEIITDLINSNSCSLSAILLRYFNPIGAHESGLIGELPTGVPANLVPYLTQTAIGLYDHVRVFGSDYDTPDGSGIRDYIHVVDLARAHIAALRKLKTDNSSNTNRLDIFNVGTGKGYSVLELIEIFTKANSIDVPFSIEPRRAGDIDKVWADTRYANNELGWKAENTIEDALVSAWKWEMNYRKKIKT
jgi:UDP-glucose 4-epimerase